MGNQQSCWILLCHHWWKDTKDPKMMWVVKDKKRKENFLDKVREETSKRKHSSYRNSSHRKRVFLITLASKKYKRVRLWREGTDALGYYNVRSLVFLVVAWFQHWADLGNWQDSLVLESQRDNKMFCYLAGKWPLYLQHYSSTMLSFALLILTGN